MESARGEYNTIWQEMGVKRLDELAVKGASLIHGFTLLENLLVDEELSMWLSS